jgi:hypothetical protein
MLIGVIIGLLGLSSCSNSNNQNIQKLRNRKTILMEEKEFLKRKRDSIEL